MRVYVKVFVGVILLSALAVGAYFVIESQSFITQNDATTLKISNGSYKNIVITDAYVNPTHVKIGDRQVIKVTVKDSGGVASVIATTQLDTGRQQVVLKPVGTEKAACVNCTWEATWEVNDTSKKKYTTTIVATNVAGEEARVDIAWIDPCSSPKVGSWILDGNCNISATDGLEMGTFTVPSGLTLTILNGGKWIYESGYPINITAGGHIVIATGGSMLRSLLWVPDIDGDGYAPSTVLTQSLTQPVGYIRRKDAIGFNDCYDNNVLAFPTATAYYTVNRGDGSFDYNCDGVASKQLGGVGSCTYDSKSGGYTAVAGWKTAVPACGVAAARYFGGTTCGTYTPTEACR